MKKLLAAATVALFLFVAFGCGDSAPEVDPIEAVTVEQVTDSFADWRYQRASKVSGNGYAISVDNIDCTINEPGEATCHDTVTITDTYGYSGPVTQSFLWSVTYDEDGEMINAIESQDNSGSVGSGSDY